MRTGVASPSPSSARGRGIACLHLTDRRIGRDIEHGDRQARRSTPTTNDDGDIQLSARHMAILPSALSHPLYHSKLRPPATKGPGKRTNRYGLDGRALDAARAHRTPDWQPSRAAPLQLLPRRAAGPRMTEPPPIDLLGPKHCMSQTAKRRATGGLDCRHFNETQKRQQRHRGGALPSRSWIPFGE